MITLNGEKRAREFEDAVMSHMANIRRTMATMSGALAFVVDEVADESTELAAIYRAAAEATCDLPYLKACERIGLFVMPNLNKMIEAKAVRLAEEEKCKQ